MSAQDHEGGGPPASGAPASGGATTSEGTPAPEQAGAEAPKVIASHGENATSAYVAAMPVPKRQRLKTVDMSKVRISADMKVEIADPRNMPTTRMEIPPGGLRPPPPPSAEIGDPASSPWSTTGGIDRSMLPSASLGTTSPGTPTSRPPAPAADEDEGGRGFGVWIAVVVVAALLGGGAAYLLRGKVPAGGGPNVSSSAPIAIGVPGKATAPAATPTAAEPSPEAPSEPAEESDGGAAPVGSGFTGGTKGYVPRKTTTTKGTGTSTGTTAPTSTGTGPKRLFD